MNSPVRPLAACPLARALFVAGMLVDVGCGGHQAARSTAFDRSVDGMATEVGLDGQTGACSGVACPPQVGGVLASGQQLPSGIAVDGTSVYWITLGTPPPPTGGKPAGFFSGGQVMKCNKSGCADAPTVLASGRLQGVSHGTPLALAVDGSDVFWSDAGPGNSAHPWQIWRCGVGGCSDNPTGVSSRYGFAIALDAANAYWSTYYGATIETCPLTGCLTPIPLSSAAQLSNLSLPAPGAPTTGIAVDGTNVYWATQLGNVLSCPISDCSTPTVLVSGLRSPLPAPVTDPSGIASTSAVSQLGQIAVDGANVYLADSNGFAIGRILKCAKSGCNGNPTTLASHLYRPLAIAVDASSVYWTEGGGAPAGPGRVAKCAIDGCQDAPVVIADQQNGPAGIAVDASHVYWTTSGSDGTDGRVLFAPK